MKCTNQIQKNHFQNLKKPDECSGKVVTLLLKTGF